MKIINPIKLENLMIDSPPTEFSNIVIEGGVQIKFERPVGFIGKPGESLDYNVWREWKVGQEMFVREVAKPGGSLSRCEITGFGGEQVGELLVIQENRVAHHHRVIKAHEAFWRNGIAPFPR
jgi:hypothetical protein